MVVIGHDTCHDATRENICRASCGFISLVSRTVLLVLGDLFDGFIAIFYCEVFKIL